MENFNSLSLEFWNDIINTFPELKDKVLKTKELLEENTETQSYLEYYIKHTFPYMATLSKMELPEGDVKVMVGLSLKDIFEQSENNLAIWKYIYSLYLTAIETDEFDKKERLILNYGHSFGHAIEKITKFKVPHGIAVANGIKIANYISFKMKYLKESDFILMNNTLNKILKGIKLYKIRTGNLIEALKKDKKNTRTNIRIVLTKGQGRMFLKKNINIKNLENILNDYKKNYLN